MEECTYKIILVGNSNVGKTTFFNKIKSNNFKLEKHSSTIGVDFSIFHKINNDINIKINLWDTAGQEKYRSLIKTYFREACGYLLMFDLNNYKSFQDLKEWYQDIENMNHCNHAHPVLLIGNKKDLESKVNNKEIQDFLAYKKNIIYNEISLKEEDNIQIIFKLLLDHITHTLYLSDEKCSGIKIKDEGIKRKSIILDKNQKSETKIKCCN
jgi:small GTP-binding protein